MVVAGIAFFALLFLALFGERIAPYEPIYFVVEHGNDPRPYDPGIVFSFGSDVLGRDLFSLVLAGARATIGIVVLAGLARVAAGVLIAAVGSWWRPTRLVTETVAELVSAIPATIVALVLVKVFVKADTSALLFIAALLVIGWAGPYRVIRAEVDRLAHAPFTEGARALGVGRWRIFWRHHLPHLVPVLAMNLTQQTVAALVLVAELGVLNAFVGTTRAINVEESMTFVRTGLPTSAVVADPPEWGGLLASSRTIEALWTTRWLILLPGIAFALTAVAIAAIGVALARRYARRDVFADLRGRAAAALVFSVLVLLTASAVVPERYAAAREWATAARQALQPSDDSATAFATAGMRPLGDGFAVTRETDTVVQTGPGNMTVGSVKAAEVWPRELRDAPVPDRQQMRSFVTSSTGGGVVEAPLVFAGRGITTADYLPLPRPIGVSVPADFAQIIRDYDYADDYAGIDVRGKVVLLVRFLGISVASGGTVRRQPAYGPFPEVSIANAIKRGAAAVIFVDPSLIYYNDLEGCCVYGLGEIRGGINPYLRAERDDPPKTTSGVPVVVIGDAIARELVRPFGIDLARWIGLDAREDPRHKVSLSRDLDVIARVQVPLRRERASITSYVAEVPAALDAGRVVVWALRQPGSPHPATDVVAAVGRALAHDGVPFVLVDFDPSIDPAANARSVREALGERRIALVVVVDELGGQALRFVTPYGDLVPAFDLYAEKAGVRYVRTTSTAKLGEISGMAPFVDVKTVVIRGGGGDGDLRPDAAALIGYLAGRLAMGAPELPR
jgi:peptide/nickel transport system permease protein